MNVLLILALNLSASNFEPSSDRVDLTAHQVLDDIADVLRECGEIPLKLQDTDSQGRAEMNLTEPTRATSILNELQRRRVPRHLRCERIWRSRSNRRQ